MQNLWIQYNLIWCTFQLRIECILLKFHWGMKALIEAHFQHEALLRFIENVLRSTLSYPNETSKECIQFLKRKMTKGQTTIYKLHHIVNTGNEKIKWQWYCIILLQQYFEYFLDRPADIGNAKSWILCGWSRFRIHRIIPTFYDKCGHTTWGGRGNSHSWNAPSIWIWNQDSKRKSYAIHHME